MKEMVVTGTQMVRQSEEAYQSRPEPGLRAKANLSMLSKGQQTAVADALDHVKQGTAAREIFLLLKQLGVTQGGIGRTVNTGLAKDIDPRLAKLYQETAAMRISTRRRTNTLGCSTN